MTRYNLTTKKSWSETLNDLEQTFRRWKISDWGVWPDRPRRKANQWHSETERKVTLTFTKNDRVVVLTMDRQDRAHDNLRVLYLAVEALRLNEARGLGEVMAEAGRQIYPALSAPDPVQGQAHAGDAYAVLGVQPGAPLAVCEAAYRALAKQAHPDAGGNAQMFAVLTAAIEQIRKAQQ